MSRCETTLSPEYPKLVPLKSAAFLSPSPLLKLLPAVSERAPSRLSLDRVSHLQAGGPWNACVWSNTRWEYKRVKRRGSASAGAAARPRG